MARADKAAAVAELTDAFRDSSAALLTEYRGLTVAQLKELRRSLAGNATYTVVKNTLTRIAAREAGVDTLEPLLEGPSAIAFVTGDPVEVAKGLKNFGRDNPMLVVKGGVLDGQPITADEIKKLADLESREVLLAKLAGGLNASAQKLVSTLAAPLQTFARLLGALEAKAKAEEPPAVEAELPTDGTPGVEETPDAPAAEAAGDEGAVAQAVADETDVAPAEDVAEGDATSTS
jgi:large subunit ribosomal protein L10